ncbi:ABC transporter family substrate-binding protein [Kutzneria sp. CA-103260]|uniref:ABC transporter family substrate-binding protein n=1 Tax=Kutzneria sp. CA-103260 TaxID=2802641 RepID=UPI001BA7C19C|nr:ABC transporter family substrate-binding protein [Kutzneria sp. CA-103260]QUQ69104.1 oligopeptide/dipeptide ABC transporter periplasmic protein [Kutzneria sp. CA-103260]
MRGRSVLLALAAAVSLLTACTDSPPPPLVSAPPTTVTPTHPTDPTQLVVGVDSVKGGYNPHLLASQTTVARALGELVLPSVFHIGPDGSPVLDQTLMVSAQVTKAAPYTVTYTIQPQAAWGDGAPIAAEDFAYLWQNMRSQPGVVDPAGYRLITGVSARDGGRVADVTFSQPYPGWRTLFNDLLPAHLLKDAPGGWTGALSTTFPVAGGPFSVRDIDQDRGEIMLQRNDRYWGQSTKLQQIVLRQAGPADLVSALKAGDDQLAVLDPSDSTMRALTELGKTVQLTTVPNPVVVQVLLRQSSPRLSDPALRAAVFAAIDREALISIGSAGGPSAALRADSLALAPSQPGYKPTIPAGVGTPNADTVSQQLTQLGYTKTNGSWIRDGVPLNLVIGAPNDRAPYSQLAGVLQQQLEAAGIGATILNTSGDQLFGTVLPSTTTTTTGTGSATPATNDQGGDATSSVDIAIVPQPVGGDPASVLAASFGCRGPLPDGTTALPAANPAGFCDHGLQPTIESALSGGMPLSDALATVEPALWQQHVAMPLFQLADVLATGPEITGVNGGPPLVGPFADAPTWRRSVRK